MSEQTCRDCKFFGGFTRDEGDDPLYICGFLPFHVNRSTDTPCVIFPMYGAATVAVSKGVENMVEKLINTMMMFVEPIPVGQDEEKH